MIQRPMENWTRFPNCILDNLSEYEPSELKVLCFMVRKTVGWNKEQERFSLRFIEKNIGMSRPTIVKAVEGLVNKLAITELPEHGERGVNIYIINWTGKESLPDVVKNFNQIKDTIKETLEDKNTEDCAGSEGRPSSPDSSSETKSKIRRPKTVYTAGRSSADKELEDHIRKRFVAERPFTEYAKQNKCVKLLAMRYCNNEPDPHSRVSMFDKMFDIFLKWKQEDKFYKTMPFTPCTMSGTTTFDKLYDAAKKRLTTTDTRDTIPPCPVCGCTLYDTHCTLCGIEVSLFGDKKAVEDYARAQGRTV